MLRVIVNVYSIITYTQYRMHTGTSKHTHTGALLRVSNEAASLEFFLLCTVPFITMRLGHDPKIKCLIFFAGNSTSLGDIQTSVYSPLCFNNMLVQSTAK